MEERENNKAQCLQLITLIGSEEQSNDLHSRIMYIRLQKITRTQTRSTSFSCLRSSLCIHEKIDYPWAVPMLPPWMQNTILSAWQTTLTDAHTPLHDANQTRTTSIALESQSYWTRPFPQLLIENKLHAFHMSRKPTCWTTLLSYVN